MSTAFKIKAVSHLEAKIMGNICFMAAILENGGRFGKLAVIFCFLTRFSDTKCVSFDSLSVTMYFYHLKLKP